MPQLGLREFFAAAVLAGIALLAAVALLGGPAQAVPEPAPITEYGHAVDVDSAGNVYPAHTLRESRGGD